MVRFSGGLLLFSAFRYGAIALPGKEPTAQNVLNNIDEGATQGSYRKLHGRFLHITDIHPDPFYKPGTNPSGSHPCHSGKGAAGYYGAEKTDCDSPMTLLDATFDWIKHNVANDIDFVIWTGDSARHDNDEKIPRTSKSIEAQNQLIVDKFVDVFAKSDDDDRTDGKFRIPIVPSFGNNDISPHNIFMPGPNRWTRKFLDIWDDFIPQQQKHSFARGGWFYTEVIPGRLAVVSLNTLYFFESNAAVDGCDNRGEPGYEHFEWLRVQLEFLRQRSMKAILIGHVPPARTANKQNWDETCYQKYILWLRQYRDVIVGNMYGHMNLDHFMLQDLKDLKYKGKIESIDEKSDRGTITAVPPTNVSSSDTVAIKAKSDYLADLRNIWCDLPSPPKGIGYDFPHPAFDGDSIFKSKKRRKLEKYLKKIGGPYGERFSLSLVSPSVVPNFYPTLRIIEYNISGLEHAHSVIASEPRHTETTKGELHDDNTPACEQDELNVCNFGVDDDVREHRKKKKKKKKKKKTHKKKPSFPVPHPPSDPERPGPAYFPQTFTLLSFTQYYANITKFNERVESDRALLQQQQQHEVTGNIVDHKTIKQLAKKHFDYEIEYSTNDDKQYRMQDLTVRRWLALAEQMGRDVWNVKSEEEDGDDFDEDTDDEYEDITYDGDEVNGHSGLDIKGKRRGSDAIKKNHLWRTFVKRAFVHAKLDDELDEEFG